MAHSIILPSALLESLENLPGFDRESFIKVHQSAEQVTSIRLNPGKTKDVPPGLEKYIDRRVAWTDYGYYLNHRPSFTFDPLFHAGLYYVQEASSMFLEHVLKSIADLSTPLTVLDLSAAPGGKSTHLQSLISNDSLLVSNEVIRSRATILKENMIRWGSHNVAVTNNDPRELGKLHRFFDIIVVDAPCSGSGLFRKDPQAITEWSIEAVNLCSQRQQRILSDIWPALKPGGSIIYSTCSYSRQEDEDIVSWLEEQQDAQIEKISLPADWRITATEKGYRFWPDKLEGEGFFLAVLRKSAGEPVEQRTSKTKIPVFSKQDRILIEEWFYTSGFSLIPHQEEVYAWPQQLAEKMLFIKENCRLIYAGVKAGEISRNKMIPDHALASAFAIHHLSPTIELNEEQAIRYLKKTDPVIQDSLRGWCRASYQGHSLGWLNILPNRVNNYYPKELRIRKENPGS